MKFSNIWKKLLVLWIAIGIAVSGYFFIFPIERQVHQFSGFSNGVHYMPRGLPTYEIVPIDKTSLLITIVGAILIGGFGKLSGNKNQ